MKLSPQILFTLCVLVSITFCASDCHTTDVQLSPVFIIPGEGIDGVRLGDSRETVLANLGEADLGGIADGLYRAWYSSEYTQGPHAGLSVYFVEMDNRPGPVDLVAVQSPYAGKTREAVGIGSPLALVHKAYGQPQKTIARSSEHWIDDFYCIGGKKLEIHYVDSLVTTISIGYFLPIPQDETNPCK
jgi:hypothetical protein